jgi:uncharacterized protein
MDDVVHLPMSDGLVVLRPSTLELVRLNGAVWSRSHLQDELTPQMQETLTRAHELVSRRSELAIPDSSSPVLQLNVAPTNFCNMGCSYCYNEMSIKDRKGSETSEGMTFETAKQMVDALVEQSGEHQELRLVFIGGEPLIERKVLFQTVAYARSFEARLDKVFVFSVYTNGLLVDEALVDWANDNRVGVVFSLDGPPLENDRFRILNSGRGTARKVLRQMRTFLERYQYPVRTVTAVLNQRGTAAATARYLYDLGFNSIQLQAAYGTSGYYDSDEDRDMEELASWYRDQLLDGRVFKLGIFTDPMIALVVREKANRAWRPCDAGHRALGVGEDGRIYPCHHFFGEDDYALGHVADGLPSATERRHLHHRVDEREPCRSCWARHACGGECYHRAHTAGVSYRGVVEDECKARKRRIGLAMSIFVDLVKRAPEVMSRLLYDDLEVRPPLEPAYGVQSLAEYEALERTRSVASQGAT